MPELGEACRRGGGAARPWVAACLSRAAPQGSRATVAVACAVHSALPAYAPGVAPNGGRRVLKRQVEGRTQWHLPSAGGTCTRAVMRQPRTPNPDARQAGAVLGMRGPSVCVSAGRGGRNRWGPWGRSRPMELDAYVFYHFNLLQRTSDVPMTLWQHAKLCVEYSVTVVSTHRVDISKYCVLDYSKDVTVPSGGPRLRYGLRLVLLVGQFCPMTFRDPQHLPLLLTIVAERRERRPHTRQWVMLYI